MLDGDRETPLPWSNVLANPEFGTMVSASGAAFTWSGNSRENRLTPFANDPISDPTGEAICSATMTPGRSGAQRPDRCREVAIRAGGCPPRGRATRFKQSLEASTRS